MRLRWDFLVVALVFSVVVGVERYFVLWTRLPFLVSHETYAWIMLALSPVFILLVVVFPFLVFYYMGKRVSSASEYWPALVSIFVGSWVGSLLIEISNLGFEYSQGADFLVWYFPFWIIWLVTSSAISGVLFVGVAGTLFAYYRVSMKQKSTSVPVEQA